MKYLDFIKKSDIIGKINSYNGNKFLAGIALLMLNIGSKYLIIDISNSTQQLLKLTIIRRFTIFCVFFIGTRNIIVSIILTSAFIVFSSQLFNDKSKYCVLPKKLQETEIDIKEYHKALEVVEKYNEQEKRSEELEKNKNETNLEYKQLKHLFNNTKTL